MPYSNLYEHLIEAGHLRRKLAGTLHQAALAGHEATVRLLVERGARLDLKDTVWQGTPEGWARHGGKTRVADYLRARIEQMGKL